MERLLEEMEGLLGCWQGLLLPLTSDPELSVQVKRLQKTLTAWGALTSEERLKAVLSAPLSCPILQYQKLPWENISCLRPRSVTHMPPLHSLLSHCALRVV